MTWTVTLPWPPASLSPNARKDRRANSTVVKSYRQTVWALAKEAKARPGAGLVITFCPPDRRRRDLDNMLASIKAGLDGIAKAAGQDDSEWSLTIRKGEPVKGGAVIVEPANG